jgi:hypothetical protein
MLPNAANVREVDEVNRNQCRTKAWTERYLGNGLCIQQTCFAIANRGCGALPRAFPVRLRSSATWLYRGVPGRPDIVGV